jgi:hypothetical protein
MSEKGGGQTQAADFDELLAQLRRQAAEAEQLTKQVQEEPQIPPPDDRLANAIAKNLAVVRRASDLPEKDAAAFEARIKDLEAGP